MEVFSGAWLKAWSGATWNTASWSEVSGPSTVERQAMPAWDAANVVYSTH